MKISLIKLLNILSGSMAIPFTITDNSSRDDVTTYMYTDDNDKEIYQVDSKPNIKLEVKNHIDIKIKSQVINHVEFVELQLNITQNMRDAVMILSYVLYHYNIKENEWINIFNDAQSLDDELVVPTFQVNASTSRICPYLINDIPKRSELPRPSFHLEVMASWE